MNSFTENGNGKPLIIFDLLDFKQLFDTLFDIFLW